MKKTGKMTATILAGVLTIALAACGGGGSAQTTTESSSSASSAASSAEAAGAAEADLSNPSITIELADADAITELGDKAQSFEIEEGTVVKIHGLLSTGLSNPSIVEETDGGRIGVVMILDGDWDMPADGTEIEAVGVYQKGQYSMEYHVDPANITVHE